MKVTEGGSFDMHPIWPHLSSIRPINFDKLTPSFLTAWPPFIEAYILYAILWSFDTQHKGFGKQLVANAEEIAERSK